MSKNRKGFLTFFSQCNEKLKKCNFNHNSNFAFICSKVLIIVYEQKNLKYEHMNMLRLFLKKKIYFFFNEMDRNN